jgi:periplasmic protein TonB
MCCLAIAGHFMPPALGQTEPTAEKIYSVKELDKVPVLTKRVDPVYPASLEKEKIKGKAVVIFIVSKEGRVTAIEAVNATNDAFAAAARDSISKWEFKPGKKGGKAVACRVVQPMEFNP